MKLEAFHFAINNIRYRTYIFVDRCVTFSSVNCTSAKLACVRNVDRKKMSYRNRIYLRMKVFLDKAVEMVILFNRLNYFCSYLVFWVFKGCLFFIII